MKKPNTSTSFEAVYSDASGKPLKGFDRYTKTLQAAHDEYHDASRKSTTAAKDLAAVSKLRKAESGEAWTAKHIDRAGRMIKRNVGRPNARIGPGDLRPNPEQFAKMKEPMRMSDFGKYLPPAHTRSGGDPFGGFEPINILEHGFYRQHYHNLTGNGYVVSERTFINDAPARLSLGGNNIVRNWDADDSDSLWSYNESGVVYSYTPENSGTLEIMALITCLDGVSNKDSNNEPGWSEGRSLQQDNFTLGQFGADYVGKSFVSLSYHRWPWAGGTSSGDSATDDIVVVDDGLTPYYSIPDTSHSIFAQLPYGVTAGKNVDITVGTRVENYALINDVGIELEQRAEWQLEFLWARVV